MCFMQIQDFLYFTRSIKSTDSLDLVYRKNIIDFNFIENIKTHELLFSFIVVFRKI